MTDSNRSVKRDFHLNRHRMDENLRSQTRCHCPRRPSGHKPHVRSYREQTDMRDQNVIKQTVLLSEELSVYSYVRHFWRKNIQMVVNIIIQKA
jgi:hypothetical protein